MVLGSCCFVVLILVSFTIPSALTSVSSMIFKKITSTAPCVRLTNATHQIGCASGFGGDRGTVQLVADTTDLRWILTDGPHAPYVALLPLTQFNGTVLASLKKSSRVNGILVIATGSSVNVSNGFSPDLPCPNNRFGLPSSAQTCQWNSIYGNSLAYESFPFSVFAIRRDADAQTLMDCYNKNNVRVNGKAPQFPLCSAEMKDFMYAVRDTYTCMRQSEVSASFSGTSGRCDALRGKNVWGMLDASNQTVQYRNRSVIMLITRLDANSFFHDLSPGAETSTTGLVTLLAAVEAIGQAKKTFGNISPVEKPIVFAVFNGESFDYIGSSRMVWEMKERTFPPNPPSDKAQLFPAPLKLSHISTIFELSQTGLSNSSGSIFVHYDQNNDSTSSVREALHRHGTQVNLNLNNGPGRLPPASVQQFLAEDRGIAGVVLADHDVHYTNRYYNSFLDDAHNLEGVLTDNPAESNTTVQITKLATTVARTVYELAGIKGNAPDVSHIRSNLTYVHELLRCFTLNFTCPLIREVLSKSSIGKIENSPGANPRYIGPSSAANQQVVVAVSAFLARSVGVNNKNVTEEKACSNSADSLNGYFWMQGQYGKDKNTDNHGQCVVAPVLQHTALSPAFDLKDYKSTKYSTWAESRWKSLSLRIYLAPSSKSQRVTFAVGSVVLVLSFLIVFQVNRVSSALLAST